MIKMLKNFQQFFSIFQRHPKPFCFIEAWWLLVVIYVTVYAIVLLLLKKDLFMITRQGLKPLIKA